MREGGRGGREGGEGGREGREGWEQCFMQRPVHPSYGRVKQNVDGSGRVIFILF